MDAAGEVPQLGNRTLQLLVCAANERARRVRIGLELLECHPEIHPE